MHIAKGGLSWILLFSLLVSLLFCLTVLFTSLLVLFIFIFFFVVFFLLVVFFRDPERVIGDGVVAVADGKIQEICSLCDPDVGDCVRISTFMNIHNVHVNRMPMDGVIEKVTHYKGGHLPAFQKESERNERVVFLVHTALGTIKVIQIAGTIARRIVPYVSEKDMVKKGGKIGLIRLGSRVDLYLPAKKIKSLMIQVNSKIKAGEDTIAEIYD